MSDDLKSDLCRKLCKGISRLEQLPRAVLDRAPDVVNLLNPTGLADDDLADMADLWMDLGCGD